MVGKLRASVFHPDWLRLLHSTDWCSKLRLKTGSKLLVPNAELVAQATLGTQLALYIEASHTFSQRFWYVAADFPPEDDSNSALLPDSFSVYAPGDYGEHLWHLSPFENCAALGELRRTVVCTQKDHGVTLVGIKLFPQPDFWLNAPMRRVLDWSVCPAAPHSGCHTFRYYTLKDAVRAACPAYGMCAFFSIRGRPALLGNLPTTCPRLAERVVLAAPVGCMKVQYAGICAGCRVHVIDELGGNWLVTILGNPRIIQVPKDKMVVICPLQVEYSFYQSRATIHFRRCILDHFAVYEDMCA